jgi:hypothetical protein
MRAAQFDYSNLTEKERLIGRLVLPFYTWTRYNIPLQIRVLASQPQSYNTILQGWDTVKDILGDENGDMYFIPSYLREAYGFAVAPEIQQKLAPLMVALGADPNDPIIARLESPILDINKFFTTQGPLGVPGVDISQFTSGSNPIAKGIIQFVAKKNLFTGKSYNDKGVDAPQWYINISNAIGSVVPSAKPIVDPQTGVLKVDERWLDFFKTTVPTFQTVDRTVAPAVDAAFSAIGIDTNFSGSGDKFFTSIASSGLGLPVSTLTPEAQAGEVVSRYRDIESKITRNLGRVDEYKLRTFVKEAQDAGWSEDEITKIGKFMLEQGQFAFVSEQQP